MNKLSTLLAALAAVAIVGCTSLKNSVFTATGTYLGIQIAENPVTDLYEAKLGYGRAEVAFVPGNTNNPQALPDVVLEFRMNNSFFRGNNFVYQRLAVGSNAVSQPGAALMFSKDANGNMSTNAIQAVGNKLSVPSVPALPKLP